MADIGIRELRAQLAAAVRRAQAGERLVVTVDGRPAAQLSAIDGPLLNSGLSDLVARGLVTPPRRRREYVAAPPITLYSGVRVDKALREIRS